MSITVGVHLAFDKEPRIEATLEPAMLGFPEYVRLRLGDDACTYLSIEQAKTVVGALLGVIKEYESKQNAPALETTGAGRTG